MGHSIYAYIKNNIVESLSVWDKDSASYTLANERAKLVYGKDAIAVDVTDIPVIIGDYFEDGNFVRRIDDVELEIKPIPTMQEQFIQLQREVNEIKEKIKRGN